jgi:pilus assembly protein Flp/PilA
MAGFRAAAASSAGRSVLLRAFWRDDQGQGMVEYALVIIVVAIAIIFMLITLRGYIGNWFSNVGNTLT